MNEESTSEDFDYARYKRLLAEATDEPKRTALIELLIEERARDKLSAKLVKQQVAQFVASTEDSVGGFKVATSRTEFQPEEGFEQRDQRAPAKTATELEAMIKVEMEAISDQPTQTVVSVQPEGDGWTARAISENSGDDRELHDMITQIADRLKTEFDLSE
ncbi:MAG: hypothetical protein NVS1B11_37780 [Terriglobales bacterium]